MIAEEGKAGRKVGEKWSAKMVPSPAASNSFVAERFDPAQEPTKDAVGTPQSHFALTWLEIAKRSPFCPQSGEVFGMNRDLPTPAVRLLRGETCIVVPSPVK